MRLDAIHEEIFTCLRAAGIGLTVPADDDKGARAEPPAPYLSLPDITYGEAGRGLDRLTDLALIIVVGPATNASTFDLALQLASSGGAKSVVNALMAYAWTTCSTLFVRSCEPSIDTDRGQNPAVHLTFHLDITGRPG